MAKICVSLMAPTTPEAIRRMTDLGDRADMFELRLDAMRECDLGELLRNRRRPIIVTNRRRDEGGLRDQPEGDRLRLLAEAVKHGADYVDVELSSLAEFERLARPPFGETRLIVSFHDTRDMPSTLSEKMRAIDRPSAPHFVSTENPRSFAGRNQ